ncbi:TROVE domain-containing protein [Streptomyces tateyamensis]|uniref:TROVE domain-containing protein n=1 Tax=Streptomyces tateyamensis TaxID=565073 RepID=A0A2V4PR72_9ACTN|nr:TROVE domain-containing protein [Streptomyces tateyamensis]PYC87450.1 TROVE domain-containing protein [Streptomyces tateyamensis]
MTRFNRQRTKSEARAEIRAETPGLTAGGATSPLSVHGQWIPVSRQAFRPSAIAAEATLNHQGGSGYLRNPKSELLLLAVAHMAGRRTFYESAADRDERFAQLVRRFAVEDPQWTLGLLRWLRAEARIRSAAVVGAAEFVRARAEARAPGFSRQAVDAVLQRPDEPGELLAYWTARYGRRLPQPLRRGVADAVRRLYTGRALLKYDTPSRAFRFGDVLELTHPTPAADRPWQGALFRYALDRRHHPDRAVPPPGELLLEAHHALLNTPTEQRYPMVTSPGGADRLAAAGMTWEALAGWLQGPLDAAVWEAVIPSMGPMALVRNLRNFDRAGIGDQAAAEVARRIADPAEVARSRQFPFRFLAAHRAAPGPRWEQALETALGHSLANVPALAGRTLVLVDRSGSMFGEPERGTELTRADAAAVFGTALALRAEQADLVEFGTGSRVVPLEPGDSVLRTVERFHDLGGTETGAAVARHYREHDRVVVITDEQPQRYRTADPFAPVPEQVPVYTWNLCGYATGHTQAGPHRPTFVGLSDAAFRLVTLLEAGEGSCWPWE